jgi:hypothetical protein
MRHDDGGVGGAENARVIVGGVKSGGCRNGRWTTTVNPIMTKSNAADVVSRMAVR